MMEYSVSAVAAFKCTVVSSVRILVKVNTKLNDTLNILCSLAYEGMYSVGIVLEAAGYEGIVQVLLYIIAGGIVYTCDTALCEHGVAERQLTLAEYEHAELLREVDSCIQSGRTAACDDDIIVLYVIRHKVHVL